MLSMTTQFKTKDKLRTAQERSEATAEIAIQPQIQLSMEPSMEEKERDPSELNTDSLKKH